MAKKVFDPNCMEFYYDTYRTWYIYVDNFSNCVPEHFSSFYNWISSTDSLCLLTSSKKLAVKFINTQNNINSDYNLFFQLYPPFGHILISYLNKGDHMEEALKVIKDKFHKFKLSSKLYTSVLIIFSLIDEVFKGEVDYDIFIIPKQNNDNKFDAESKALVNKIMNGFFEDIYFCIEKEAISFKNNKMANTQRTVKLSVESDFEHDMDNKLFSKLMYFRNKKLLGDLYLKMGLYSRAIALFLNCIDIFSMFGDNLWLSATTQSIGLAILYANDEINSSGMTCSTKFEIKQTFLSVKLYELEDIDYHNKAIQLIGNKLPDKYWINSISTYTQYFMNQPMFIEYHFYAVILYYFLNANILKTTIIEFIGVIYPRILTFNNIKYKIQLLLLLSRLLHKIGWLKRKAFFLYKFITIVISNELEVYYKRATWVIKHIFKIHNKSIDPSLNIDCGWTDSYLVLLLNLITLYIARSMHNRALKIAFFLFSHLKCDIDDRSKQFIMSVFKKNPTHSLISPIEHIPYTKEFIFDLSNHVKIQNISKFSKSSVGPFIYDTFIPDSSDLSTLLCLKQEASIILTLQNPLPLRLVSYLEILSDNPKICYCEPYMICIPSLDKTQKCVLKFRPEEIGKFSVLGYTSTFFGMKSIYKLPKPYNFNCVNVSSIPVFKLESLENIIDIKDTVVKAGHIFSLTVYEGSISKARLNINYESNLNLKNIFFRYKKTDIISITKLPKSICDISSQSVSLDFIFGHSFGFKPLLTGNYSTDIKIFPYDISNGYCIETSIKIQISVIPLISLSDYSMAMLDNHPSCSLCFIKCSNPTKNDIQISVNLTNTCCKTPLIYDLLPENNIKMKFHIPKISYSSFIKYKEKYTEKYMFHLISDLLNIKWKININNVSFFGVSVGNYSIPNVCLPTLLQIPYCFLKSSFLEAIVSEDSNILCKTQKLHDIVISVTNPLDYCLNDIRISLMSPNILKGSNKTIIWTGSLCQSIPKLESHESKNITFSILFIDVGIYNTDIIVQLIDCDTVVDQMQKYLSMIDDNSSLYTPDILFSVTSKFHNTYISCLACQSLTFEALDSL